MMLVSPDGTITIREISLVGTGKWMLVRDHSVVLERIQKRDPNADTRLERLLARLGLSVR